MNDFQKQIWQNNYKAPQDNTIEDTFKRVAKAASLAETDEQSKQTTYEQFYKYMSEWKFLPGGRIIANAGVKSRGKATLYNCYVYNGYDFGIRDIDSIQGIYESLKKSAKVLASEGGLGINVTFMRPNGSYIRGTGVRTPGVLKFLELWDKSSEIITMGSDKNKSDKYSDIAKKKIRKGAQIAVLDINHAQVKDFIIAKQTPNRLTKFNLSILISDRFMEAVQKDSEWNLCFPDIEYAGYKNEWDGDLEGWIKKGKPITIYETLPARELWDLIMLSTYNRNEPGVLFYDTLNDLNPVSYCETILTTNPCGQIGMSSNVCNLGSLNLVNFWKDGQFDWDQFEQTVKVAVTFLDNVCDISFVPLTQYQQKIKDKRRIGLGVLGEGSLLMMMGMKFGSHQAIAFVQKLFKVKAETELITSAILGKLKGSFKDFNAEKYFSTRWWYQLPISYKLKRQIENIGCMRNSVHSTVPPTGNLAIFAGQVSNGIEPVFMKEYTRWMIVNEDERRVLTELHDLEIMDNNQNSMTNSLPNPQLGQWHETQLFKFAERGTEQILRGSIGGQTYQIDKNRGLIKSMDVKDYGWRYVLEHGLSQQGVVQIDQISVDDHINMLAASAKFINQNQSKTINIPEDYPYQDFKNVYMSAWKRNIKGITTYRAGTMTVVLQKKKDNEEYQSELEKMFKQNKDKVILQDVKIPHKSYALQYKVKDNNKKKWYFTISFADKHLQRPIALFIRTNNRQSNQVTDIVIQAMQSLLVKKGIKESLIVDQRQKYQGQSNMDKIGRSIGMALRHNVPVQDVVETLEKHSDGLSTLLFHIRRVLGQFIKDGTKVNLDKVCSECGANELVYQGGCSTCPNCGNSKCS